MRMGFTAIGIAALGLSTVLAACGPSSPPTPTAVPTATLTKVPSVAATVAPTMVPATAPTVAPTKAAAATPATTPSADLATGKTVFTANCDVCHPGGAKGVGPSIKGASQDTVRKKVRTGGGGMPVFGLDKISDAQLDALAAYLASLR